ncbi:hypothetical protein COO60DRAFT_1488039 [Scenedesmus sp. NREL 46B-D3]|nr:hypothetical protein COO60DRAFT_1488039 [Scenedesmus sp. NREL 46B-D3]
MQLLQQLLLSAWQLSAMLLLLNKILLVSAGHLHIVCADPSVSSSSNGVNMFAAAVAGAAAAAAARKHFIHKVLILLHLQHQQEWRLVS